VFNSNLDRPLSTDQIPNKCACFVYSRIMSYVQQSRLFLFTKYLVQYQVHLVQGSTLPLSLSFLSIYYLHISLLPLPFLRVGL